MIIGNIAKEFLTMIAQKLSINHVDISIREQRLLEIGISEERIELVILQANSQFNNSTPNDRSNDAGNRSSSATFRELANTLGWIKAKKDNIEFIHNPRTARAIIPYAGNQDTGIVEGFPETKHRRGKQTKLPVNSKPTQVDIFPTESFNFNYLTTDKLEIKEAWILLYYRDKATKEVRYELSSPKSKDKFPKGHINDWHERLIFTPISFDDTVKALSIDSQEHKSQDFDIPVEFLEK